MRGQKKLYILFVVISVLFLNGCSIQPVEFKGIGGVDVQSINNNVITLKVTATINNPNSRMTIKNSEMDVFLKNKQFGKITQLENIVIEGKTTKAYTTLVRVELSNNKGGILSAISLFNGKRPDLKVTGLVKVTMPFFWKTLSVKDYPITL